jgi:hypothetical protein
VDTFGSVSGYVKLRLAFCFGARHMLSAIVWTAGKSRSHWRCWDIALALLAVMEGRMSEECGVVGIHGVAIGLPLLVA